MLDGVDDLAGGDRATSARARRGGWACWSTTSCRAPRRAGWSTQARSRGRYAAHVKVLGHPYVDVWQSVRPERLGWRTWPVIPRGQSWKHGIVRRARLAAPTQADIAHAWKRILGTVRTYADLEPPCWPASRS